MFGGGTNDTAVSAEEFEEMRNELENLKEEHQDVTAELEEVTTDFDALQEEYDTLNNNHKELIEKRDQVDAENSRLQKYFPLVLYKIWCPRDDPTNTGAIGSVAVHANTVVYVILHHSGAQTGALRGGVLRRNGEITLETLCPRGLRHV